MINERFLAATLHLILSVHYIMRVYYVQNLIWYFHSTTFDYATRILKIFLDIFQINC